MSGGEPPLPPPRIPYPPWQGRPYRRRGGGPPAPRNGWVGRRPRSPPPPPRPRHPRGGPPHRHHRHLSQPHPSSQSHSHQSAYHHHGPPPLSRNLQGRLRSPPRSPPPRRSDLGLHRDEPPRGEPHQDDRDRLDQHRGEPLRGEPLRGEPPLRGDPHRGDALRGEPHRGDSHRGEPLRGEPHRPEHRGEPPHRGDQRPGDQHRPDHPYRGEPGPPHRIDPPDRGPYRGGEPYGPPRGLPSKPRGEPGPFRSEQRLHRGSGDHHVPYRGEPGPLYRADLPSHRDDLDSRRGPGDSAPGRPDSSYSQWYRHPSKIHKPVKRKMRRHSPHIGALPRPLQMSKPESPILSRMSFPHAERGSASSRTDAMPSSSLISSKASASFPNSSSKWHTEPSPRFSANSPRPSEPDPVRRFDRGPRFQGLSGSTSLPLKKKPPLGFREQSRSPNADSFSSRSGGFAGRGSVISKSQSSEEPGMVEKRSPTMLCNGKKENGSDVKRQEAEGRVNRSHIHSLSARGSEKVSCNAVSTLNSNGSQERTVDRHVGRVFPKATLGSSVLSTSGPSQKLGSLAGSLKHTSIEDAKDETMKAVPATGKQGRAVVGKSILAAATNLQEKDSPARVSHHSVQSKNDLTVTGPQEKSLSRQAIPPDPSDKPAASFTVTLPAPAPAPSRSSEAPLSSIPNVNASEQIEGSRQKQLSPPAHSGAPAVEVRSSSCASAPIVRSTLETVPTVPDAIDKQIRSAGVPNSAPKTSESPSAPTLTPASEKTAMAKKNQEPVAREMARVPDSYRSSIEVNEPVPTDTMSLANCAGKHVAAVVTGERKMEESKKESGPTVPPEHAASTPSLPEKAPILPNVNLRSILESGLTSSSTAAAQSTTPTTPLPDLRSLLRPVPPVTAKGKEAKASPAPVSELRSSPNSKKIPSASASPPVARGPVSVPASAMSFLRSSPRSRGRGSTADAALSSLNSIGLIQSPARWHASREKTKSERPAPENDTLVQGIHETEKEISAVERKLAQLRALKPISTAKKAESEKRVSKTSAENEGVQKFASIARTIAAGAEGRDECLTSISPVPMHAALRLLVVHNHAKAAAASAALRPLCSDPEIGLCSMVEAYDISADQISEEVFAAVTTEVARREGEVLAQKRKLSREYSSLRESWIRKLKSARDKKSKEKREATKERDRFLVLRTKGHSALLSSRTSSGRMSTKIIPSLNVNGQVNNNAEVDALLAEIAAEGGTPGSKEIWSKTLADIPDQDASVVPCDNGSVLVEDPIADFTACRWVNPWRFEEKLVYLEKFVIYPKNFRKIASFLEHKSTRECSQFYYMNKLDLGLKQLAKESSTLKRKGILKSHIVNLAKKRLCFESEDSIAAHTKAFLLSQNLVNGSNYERGLNSEMAMDFGGGAGNGFSEKRQTLSMKMMLKKRIVAEHVSLDMSDIDFDKFARTIAMFGTDWKKVSSAMEVPGKSSTHYREFYQKNRRRLRVDDTMKQATTRLTAFGRSPTPPLRQSPRISPRGSPTLSPSPSQRKLGRGISSGQLDDLMLDDEELPEFVSASSRKHRKNASPSARSPTPQPQSSAELDRKSQKETTKRGEGEIESRKSKTSTWTAEEGEQFRRLFKRHPRDWKKIAHIMSPKTPMQVKGYWKKIAHEVGNGLPSDAVRSSKSDKKRPRRSTSLDGLVKGGMDEETRSSPDKKSPSSGHSGTPHSDRSKRDLKRQRSEQVQEGRGEESSQGVGRKLQESKPRSKVPSAQIAEGRGKTWMNGDLGGGRTGREVERGKNMSDEETPSKRGDGRSLSNTRLSLLRSAPLPMFRSVPVAKTMPDGSSASGNRTGSGPLPQDMGLGVGNRKSEDGPRQAELRKTAESYGVLALLGSRLEDASNAQKGKR